MLRDTIHDIVAKTLVSLRENGALPMVDLPAFEVERPQSVEHGDYATNAAMKLAAAVRATGEKVNPRALAETIAAHLRETVDVVPAYDLISGVEVAGPGFINFRLKPEWRHTMHVDLITHGRRVCHAQRPACPVCPLRAECHYYWVNVAKDTQVAGV